MTIPFLLGFLLGLPLGGLLALKILSWAFLAGRITVREIAAKFDAFLDASEEAEPEPTPRRRTLS